MNVVSVSHLNLVRARREMEKAFANREWDAVRDWDLLLSEQLNRAFDDGNRDNRLLMEELEKVLALYGKMVQVLPESAMEYWPKPELGNL